MSTASRSIYWEEACSLLYLASPLFLFFAFFVRFEMAVPACLLMVACAFALIRDTDWKKPVLSRTSLYYLGLSALWIWMSGGFGVFHQNSDWLKHYSIINFLAQNRWPAEAVEAPIGQAAIRYSIGWYLVPALALKLTNPHWQNAVASLWSIAGVFFFFSLLPKLAPNTRSVAIVTPLVFIVFGGADLLGTMISGYQHGPQYHFQWWSGWIEFPANTTSIFWVPQHAIPSWIGLALLMGQRSRTALLPYAALLFSAVLLWSPFAALGLFPFALALLWQHGARSMMFGWQPIAAALLLAVPISSYLLSGVSSVPHGMITKLRCVLADGACFTWFSYARFLLIEVGIPLLILAFRRHGENGFLLAAALTLCLFPLYRVGANNDFAMRATIPALALLAILCADVLVTGPRMLAAAVALVLIAALPTTIGEIRRGLSNGPNLDVNTSFDSPWAAAYTDQYFAPLPIWILRP